MTEVAAGLIILDDRILICQRHENDRHHPLKWEFPGGKLQGDETAGEALVRELQEELNIQILEYEKALDHTAYYPGLPPVHLHFFKVTEYLSIAKNRVFRDIKWIRISELGDYDFLEGDGPVVDALLKGRISVESPCLHCRIPGIK